MRCPVRGSGRDILEMLGSRRDLYADAYFTIDRLRNVSDQHVPFRKQTAMVSPATASAEPPAAAKDFPSDRTATVAAPTDEPKEVRRSTRMSVVWPLSGWPSDRMN